VSAAHIRSGIASRPSAPAVANTLSGGSLRLRTRAPATAGLLRPTPLVR